MDNFKKKNIEENQKFLITPQKIIPFETKETFAHSFEIRQ